MSRETLHRRPVTDRATCLDLGSDASSNSPLSPRDAFLVAYDRIASLAAVADGPAVIVAAVSPERRVLEAVIIEDGRALILGRHSRCGLQLHASPVALRHVAVLVRAEGEAVVSRLWDLNTGAPFLTEGGQPTAALIADGPLYIAVHGYALWLIPAATARAWPDRAGAAWSALPRPAFIDQRPPAAPAARGKPRAPTVAPLPVAPPAPRRPRDEISRITLLGPALVLGEPDDVEVGWGALRLQQGARRMRHHVSAERLDRGILIGRYDRCGLEIDDPDNHVSRVHALLVKIGGDVWAIDTASTNGLWRAGACIEAEILADIDTLGLGTAATLGWQRQKHADA